MQYLNDTVGTLVYGKVRYGTYSTAPYHALRNVT